MESFYDPFRHIHCFYVNDILTDKWNEANSEYKALIKPALNTICEKLKKEIYSDQQSTPTQLMREF